MNEADPAEVARSASQDRLCKTIGWVAVLLPFALYFGNRFLHPNHHPLWPYSVSGYYYTHMRNVAVLAFGALAALLVVYRGHDNADRWITNIAALLVVLVVFFPTTPTRPPFYHGPTLPNHEQRIYGIWHMTFAVALLLTLTVITLRFTWSGEGRTTGPAGELRRMRRQLWYSPPRAGDSRSMLTRKRDAVYRVCARLTLAAMALAAISKVLPSSTARWHLVFFLEAIAICCVGIAWLVQGQVIFADPDPHPAA